MKQFLIPLMASSGGGSTSNPAPSLTVEDVITTESTNLTVGVGTQQKTSGSGGTQDAGGVSSRAINSGTGYVQGVPGGSAGGRHLTIDDVYLNDFDAKVFRFAFQLNPDLTWELFECMQPRPAFLAQITGNYIIDTTVFRIQVDPDPQDASKGIVSFWVDENGTDDFVLQWTNDFNRVTYPCFLSTSFSGFSRPWNQLKIAGNDLVDNTNASELDISITDMNVYASNERYNAFPFCNLIEGGTPLGDIIGLGPTQRVIEMYYRSGLSTDELTGHLLNGQIRRMRVDEATQSLYDADVHIFGVDGKDIRDPITHYMDGQRVTLISQYWDGIAGENREGSWFAYSDDAGATWEYWDDVAQQYTSDVTLAYDIMSEFGAIRSGWPFGRMIPSGNPNEFLIMLPYFMQVSNDWRNDVLRSTIAQEYTSFTSHNIWDDANPTPGAEGKSMTETAIVGIGNDRFICQSRELNGADNLDKGGGLWQTTTDDNFATHSNWVYVMGNPVFDCIPELIYLPTKHEVISIYQDRGYGYTMISVTDADQAFLGNYNTPKFLYKNRNTAGFGGGIGYGRIISLDDTDTLFWIIISVEYHNTTTNRNACEMHGRIFNYNELI